MNLAGLMLCLFRYYEHARKTLVYALVFFLGNLLSNYYWGVYMLVMHDYPNVSSMFAYFGWNMAFVMLALLQVSLRKEQGIRSFSPLSLIPVPVNIIQLVLYLQYGGIFNNVWQVFWTTVAECLALDNIIYYFKNKKSRQRFPYISVMIFIFLVIEYAEWTSTCFDWPSEWLYPYNYLSLICNFIYVLIPLSFAKEYGKEDRILSEAPHMRLMKRFKWVYSVVVFLCCTGGLLLALWTKRTLDSGIMVPGDTDPYSIISVMLFAVSVIIVLFTMVIVLIVSSAQKSYEGEELKRAKSSAERSNATKSEFLANMSHEIRTPINAVLGMNEMILRESLEARDDLPEDRGSIRNVFSDICTYSGNIESAGKSLLSIINDILDFSKIEAGRMELIDAPYKLSSVLNDVSNMIRFKAEGKGLVFDVRVDSSIPDDLCGDEVRIRQIITNLLNNAVKYTERGSVILSVSEKREDGNAEDLIFLIISVRDTGIGIRDEDKEKLFRKFERLDTVRNSSVEGTGLGLAITCSLVEMMGGTVSVESEYGAGSDFTAVIPQRSLSDEPIGDFREKFENSIESMKARKESFHAEDASILVVDDTQMNLTVVRGLLKNIRIGIDTAKSGEEAIRLAGRNHYDIIFMDQRMPVMDGTTAMKRIREDAGGINSDTPFICLTADAIQGAKERYISEGFSDYLSKPIDSRRLEDILRDWLPEEKLSYGDDEASEDGAPSEMSEEGVPVLKSQEEVFDPKVIDKKTGLIYCANDEKFYEKILSEYLYESKEKASSLDRCYEEKNWEEYGIYVHSLKSTSKMIGARELSDIAMRLEKAAKSGDGEGIELEHAKMRRLYDEVTGMLRQCVRPEHQLGNAGHTQ